MIRVLHVIASMNRGGAENMIMNLYRAIDRTHIQFDFVECTNVPAAFDEEILSLGGRIFRCPRYTVKNHCSYVCWWNSFFSQYAKSISIVHGHIGSTASIYLHIAKKYKLFTIAHSHNTQTQYNIRSIFYSLYAYPTRFIADQCFACSRSAGISRYGKKIGSSQSRCIVLPNAIHVNSFRFNPSIRKQMQTLLGVSGRPVIGHVGRFSPQKNHIFLLEIFSELLVLVPDAMLLLVGGGALQSKIEHYIHTHALSQNVILAGTQPDVSPYYQTMDLFLFPSLYEGLPVSMVEAQASGLPCVISDKVPPESILVPELVTVQKLQDAPASWAKHIAVRLKTPRVDCGDAVRDRGYDISKTAKWLEAFYLDQCKKQPRP